jgi:hypothetical protein
MVLVYCTMEVQIVHPLQDDDQYAVPAIVTRLNSVYF